MNQSWDIIIQSETETEKEEEGKDEDILSTYFDFLISDLLPQFHFVTPLMTKRDKKVEKRWASSKKEYLRDLIFQDQNISSILCSIGSYAQIEEFKGIVYLPTVFVPSHPIILSLFPLLLLSSPSSSFSTNLSTNYPEIVEIFDVIKEEEKEDKFDELILSPDLQEQIFQSIKCLKEKFQP